MVLDGWLQARKCASMAQAVFCMAAEGCKVIVAPFFGCLVQNVVSTISVLLGIRWLCVNCSLGDLSFSNGGRQAISDYS